MNKAQQKRFKSLYQQHLNALERQGKSKVTIDAYSRAVRRITTFFDRCPDRLTTNDLKEYFTSLVKSHSWSTVKIDRNGLQFFYKHIINKQWHWVDIVKPPVVKTLPDILTTDEISLIINSTREIRYQTYILTVYSMGLRLGEALKLKIGDIAYRDVGKGRKLGAEASMLSAFAYMYAVAKVAKIVLLPYLIGHCLHLESTGPHTATRRYCFPGGKPLLIAIKPIRRWIEVDYKNHSKPLCKAAIFTSKSPFIALDIVTALTSWTKA